MPAPLPVEPLTPGAFAPFGSVLRRDPAGEPFQPLHTDPTSHGWRVAILAVEPGPLRQVHRHPDSEECFSPISGAPLFAVAPEDEPEHVRLFRLTEPVCVRRGIWHQMVAGDASTVFIAENATLSGEVHPLPVARTWEA